MVENGRNQPGRPRTMEIRRENMSAGLRSRTLNLGEIGRVVFGNFRQ